jgi:transposase
MKKRKTYDAAFKKEAIAFALSSDQRLKETASDLGIEESTLTNWVSKARRSQTVEIGAVAMDIKTLQAELLKSRKECQRLKDTCEILKKATAYFANEPKHDIGS